MKHTFYILLITCLASTDSIFAATSSITTGDGTNNGKDYYLRGFRGPNQGDITIPTANEMFVNGILTYNFEGDGNGLGYFFIMVCEHGQVIGDCYMAANYTTESHCTLYKEGGTHYEKMGVPAPSATFYLYDNEDGTLELSTEVLDGKKLVKQCQITVSSSDDTKGTVTGSGVYNYGEIATLTATVIEGNQFNGWNDGNTDNPREVEVTGNATYTANFGVKMCQLTIKPNDIMAGSVSGGGTFEYGTQVTITANENSGYQFIKWSNGATYNPYRFTIVDNMNLTAFFQQTQAEIVNVDDVDVTPSENSANIVWPQVNNAASYSLIIWADALQSEKVCTLTFDASGRLTNIDFSKKSNRYAYAQEEQIAGFSFTVTGLDENTQYFFRIVAANSGGIEISHEDGNFKTTKGTTTSIKEIGNGQSSNRKLMIDGQLYIFRDGKIYTVQGQEVK